MLNMAMTSFLLRPQVPAKKTAKYESDAVVKDLTIVCQDGSFETSHVLWLQTSKLLRDRQAAFQTLNEGPRPTTDEQQPPANDGNIKEFDLSAYKMSAAVYLDRMVASDFMPPPPNTTELANTLEFLAFVQSPRAVRALLHAMSSAPLVTDKSVHVRGVVVGMWFCLVYVARTHQTTCACAY
eukprot:m.429636 g.429636  ORF g.429636 m.429636 type:complete len:182 (-) comp20239_c1_seq2:36-581(-)